jgi:hypothetical protein
VRRVATRTAAVDSTVTENDLDRGMVPALGTLGRCDLVVLEATGNLPGGLPTALQAEDVTHHRSSLWIWLDVVVWHTSVAIGNPSASLTGGTLQLGQCSNCPFAVQPMAVHSTPWPLGHDVTVL